MRSKKGDLSMGVIIGAAIALLILVVLSVMIFRAAGNTSEGTSCYGIKDGAYCEDDDIPCDEGYVMNRGADCSGDGMKCCVPFP